MIRMNAGYCVQLNFGMKRVLSQNNSDTNGDHFTFSCHVATDKSSW